MASAPGRPTLVVADGASVGTTAAAAPGWLRAWCAAAAARSWEARSAQRLPSGSGSGSAAVWASGARCCRRTAGAAVSAAPASETWRPMDGWVAAGAMPVALNAVGSRGCGLPLDSSDAAACSCGALPAQHAVAFRQTGAEAAVAVAAGEATGCTSRLVKPAPLSTGGAVLGSPRLRCATWQDWEGVPAAGSEPSAEDPPVPWLDRSAHLCTGRGEAGAVLLAARHAGGRQQAGSSSSGDSGRSAGRPQLLTPPSLREA